MPAPAALRRFAPAAACAFLLFWGLGRPALWQDEAETALLGQSVARHGLPLVRLDGRLISGQPSLASYESNDQGVWIWNTWLPYYAAAASFKVFGVGTWAARAPFAFFAFLAFLLAGSFFDALAEPGAAEIAKWLLALNVPWLLFMRQCRYYSLACFGLLAALYSYRLILKGKRLGPAALAASLTFLFHSFFVMGPIVIAALGIEASHRRGKSGFQRRFWSAAAAAAALALPFAWYFRVWTRPGNHMYPVSESAQFLRTFLLWLMQFSAAWPLLALALARRRGLRIKILVLAGYAALAVMISLEGDFQIGSLLFLGFFAGLAWEGGPPAEEISSRSVFLLCALSLLVFSLTGAEPYGRYLAPILPFFCLATAAAIEKLAGPRRRLAAFLAILCATTNIFSVLPIKVGAVIAPQSARESVSGMMRSRLRQVPLRSDLFSFIGEIGRGARGYVEELCGILNRLGLPGQRAFSPADNLSLMFYTGLNFMTPAEFAGSRPEWIIPSPWLELDQASKERALKLVEGGLYEKIEFDAPRILWQNNPDILYHVFNPRNGAQALFRLAEEGTARISASTSGDR